MSRILVIFVEMIAVIALGGCASPDYNAKPSIIYWGDSSKPVGSKFGMAEGKDLAVDPSGNMYVLGEFNGKISFNMKSPSAVREANDKDVSLAKYDKDGNFAWVKSWGLSKPPKDMPMDYNQFARVAVISGGDILITGHFKGTWDFDPGPGVQERSSDDETSIYLLRLNPDGEFINTTIWPNTGSYDPFRIYVDSVGRVYLAGTYKVNLDLDLGNGSFGIKVPPSGEGFFLAKFADDLSPTWVRTWDKFFMLPLVIDTSGNIYLAGSFTGQLDFDPGPGTSIQTGSKPGDGYGTSFLMKINTDGDFQWVRSWTSRHDLQISDLATDVDGNVYSVGAFWGLVDFDPGPMKVLRASIGHDENAYLSKMDPDGNFMWVRTWGNGSKKTFSSADRMAINGAGQVFVAGLFAGEVDFNPGVRQFPIAPSGEGDAYISLFDTEGNWKGTQAFGTDTAFEPVMALKLDHDGNPVVVGYSGFNGYFGRFQKAN